LTKKQIPIFIIGCPRSGTTLLSSILNRHSEVCVTPELHYFGKLDSLNKEINNTNEAIAFYNSLINKDIIRINNDTLARELNTFDNGEFKKNTFLAICNAYKKKKGKTICIEKTPDNVRFTKEILALFPNALFIYITRDGRDVALSLEKVNWDWPYRGYYSNLIYWAETTKLLSKSHHIKSPNSHHIKYEDLLDNPKHYVAKICEFIDVTFEQKMLAPDGSESDLIEKGTTIKENIKKNVIKSNKDKWEKILSPAQTLLSWKLASKELKQLGYKKPGYKSNGNKTITSGKNTIQFGFLSDKAIVESLWGLGYEIAPMCDATLESLQPKRSDAIWIIDKINISHEHTKKNIIIIINTIYKIIYSKVFGIKIFFTQDSEKHSHYKNWLPYNLLEKLINLNAINLQHQNCHSHTEQANFLLNTLSVDKRKQ